MYNNNYACILVFDFLQGTAQVDLLDNTQFAVPVFHAYGHNMSCQVLNTIDIIIVNK